MASTQPQGPEMGHWVQKQYMWFFTARPGGPGADAGGDTNDDDHNHHANNNES